MWLEQLAHSGSLTEPYPFPYAGGELDFRPLLQSVVRDRVRGRDRGEIARAFQRGLAQGLRDALVKICKAQSLNIVVLSGGVFQNELLLEDLKALLGSESLEIWTNHARSTQRWRDQLEASSPGGICGPFVDLKPKAGNNYARTFHRDEHRGNGARRRPSSAVAFESKLSTSSLEPCRAWSKKPCCLRMKWPVTTLR
jgi:hypothetical protein